MQPRGRDLTKIITRDELMAKIDRGDDFVLIEALPADVYERGHLPAALNLSYDWEYQILQLAAALVPKKDTAVVVYCLDAVGTTADTVVTELSRYGYTDVRHYSAGKSDWIGAGLPMQGAGSIPSLARPRESPLKARQRTDY
jgi:rhodanese-related sulfurtransferase